jgi:hypothetical protein
LRAGALAAAAAAFGVVDENAVAAVVGVLHGPARDPADVDKEVLSGVGAGDPVSWRREVEACVSARDRSVAGDRQGSGSALCLGSCPQGQSESRRSRERRSSRDRCCPEAATRSPRRGARIRSRGRFRRRGRLPRRWAVPRACVGRGWFSGGAAASGSGQRTAPARREQPQRRAPCASALPRVGEARRWIETAPIRRVRRELVPALAGRSRSRRVLLVQRRGSCSAQLGSRWEAAGARRMIRSPAWSSVS